MSDTAPRIVSRVIGTRPYVGPKENLPERVENGGANIPIDDPAGPHDEQSKANTQQGASVCRMLVRSSTDRCIKRPHRSSFQKDVRMVEVYRVLRVVRDGLSDGQAGEKRCAR